ncbi:MAG: hypothetical protein WBC31_13255 [Candidatus Phosphoribacter baldrii]
MYVPQERFNCHLTGGRAWGRHTGGVGTAYGGPGAAYGRRGGGIREAWGRHTGGAGTRRLGVM